MSRRQAQGIGKSGYALVTEALTALRDGRPLVFEEEYGLETLWHEILHNGQAHRVPGSPAEIVRLAEGLHQVLARQTYPEFLRLLGAEAAHARAVRERGFAYPMTVARLTGLLRALGAMDESFVIEPALLGTLRDLNAATDFASLADELGRALLAFGGRGEIDIEHHLRAIAEGKDP